MYNLFTPDPAVYCVADTQALDREIYILCNILLHFIKKIVCHFVLAMDAFRWDKWTFQGGTSFMDLLCVFFCLVIAIPLYASVFCALWSPTGKGLTSWLSFAVSNCEFVTFPLVSSVRCGT